MLEDTTMLKSDLYKQLANMFFVIVFAMIVFIFIFPKYVIILMSLSIAAVLLQLFCIRQFYKFVEKENIAIAKAFLEQVRKEAREKTK